MDGLPRLYLARKNVDRDLLESFATEFAIELLDLELCREAQHTLELAQRVLILARLLLQMLGKCSKPVCLWRTSMIRFFRLTVSCK